MISATFRMLAVALILCMLAASCTVTPAPGVADAQETGGADRIMPQYRGTTNAPEFPTGMQWLNADRPLSLVELEGKVVLLDFWTYCCINCIHILPDLKRLEHEYPDQLVVIGVHSAKFDAERDVENIRSAIQRYEIEHPVVNDRDMRIWDLYTARAWPTVVLINPEGRIVLQRSGEGVYDAVKPHIEEMVAQYRQAGLLDSTPLEIRREEVEARPLSFPGKVLADEASGRLFVADSNNNRIVIATLEGEVLDIAGSGAIGFDDGSFEEATFDHPQGMALSGDALYVADTDNHAIRRLHLSARRVETVAGTGRQGRITSRGGIGTEIALNSPWDLVIENGTLYIAMAGNHMLWSMDPNTLEVQPFAGSGREALIDGSRASAALAQPSGITSDGRRLYFVDSEASAVRWVDLPPADRVGTIVGQGLFDFGDRDGIGRRALLQHPLAIVHHAGELFIADTYNNKVKRINPRTGSVETILGTGEQGLRDGEHAQFDEPGGISYADGRLFIADTNNHAIRVAAVDGGPVMTLALYPRDRLMPPAVPECPVMELERRQIAPGDAQLVLRIDLGEGRKLNPEAPTQVAVRLDGALRFADGSREATVRNPDLPMRLPLTASTGEGTISITMNVYSCEGGPMGACYFAEGALNIPLTVSPEATGRAIEVEWSTVTKQQQRSDAADRRQQAT